MIKITAMEIYTFLKMIGAVNTGEGRDLSPHGVPARYLKEVKNIQASTPAERSKAFWAVTRTAPDPVTYHQALGTRPFKKS